MARDYYVNGETLVLVKGNVNSGIATLSELGLAADQIRITPQFFHRDIKVDAWGDAPPEIQFMLMEIRISMTLVHFDPDVLNVCLRESMGGASAPGTLTRAGSRMGNNVARFAAGNHFIGLNLTSPVIGLPWRFYFSYLTGPPIEVPLGTEKSQVVCNWRAVPFTIDPYNSGSGAAGTVIFDRILDT